MIIAAALNYFTLVSLLIAFWMNVKTRVRYHKAEWFALRTQIAVGVAMALSYAGYVFSLYCVAHGLSL